MNRGLGSDEMHGSEPDWHWPQRLGVPATTRNWNTIEKVVKILQANR